MKSEKELEELILKHKELYYQGKAIISDEDYDKLEDDLRSLNPESYVLQLVGAANTNEDKIEHKSKMLSLEKTYVLEKLLGWKGDHDIIGTMKIDGSSCSLLYTNGNLIQGKTRGDGKFGENISSKVFCIENIPKKVNDLNLEFEVRGEVYCLEENFLMLAQEMERLGLDRPTSQRNIVAGILGRKENRQLAKYLSFQAFEIITEKKFKTEVEKFEFLHKLGFETPDYILHKGIKSIEIAIEQAKIFMMDGNYLIDGLVFAYNDCSLHEELGATAHHPKYKMAFKFQGETKVTKIQSITWQVSRNGILTPVANVEPVELSSAMISRVTLHNWGMVKAFKLKVGDEIEIVRSGEVIPKFLAVKESSRNKLVMPEICPSCGKSVDEADIRLICKNSLCPEKIIEEILYFIKRMEIEDINNKRLEQMIAAKIVTDIPSLYDLKVDDLLGLEKVKDKLANKIVENIEKSKNVTLVKFITALGIAGIAESKCEKIIDHGFDSLEKILKITEEELVQVESFAEKSSREFVQSLQDRKLLISKLLKKGIKIVDANANKVESQISGKKICITGALSRKRADIEKTIKLNGGIAVSSVSSQTDYLVTNETEGNSSKFIKAKELNITIITEEQLFELLTKHE
jgi:DNA ligase (NAD+)